MSSKSKEDRSQLLSGLMVRKPAAAAAGAAADKDRVKPASITSMGTSIRELGALGRAAQSVEVARSSRSIRPNSIARSSEIGSMRQSTLALKILSPASARRDSRFQF